MSALGAFAGSERFSQLLKRGDHIRARFGLFMRMQAKYHAAQRVDRLPHDL